MDFLLATIGLVMLLLAGDSLVRGAVNMSLRLGVPALIVSLTIVALGTSAPELLVSVNAVLMDAPGLALGNVVGSNIANSLLVLGFPALFATLDMGTSDTRKSYVIMLLSSVGFIVLCVLGPLIWWHGLILLAGLALMLTDQLRAALAHRQADAAQVDAPTLEGAMPNMPWWKISVFLALGLIGLPLGADILVSSSTNIARAWGVSETVIGLTLVAIGTSLPELATTVMAALRKQADVAMGNVIGSNLFNLLGIIGVASLVGPIPVNSEFLQLDLWVMLGASLLLAPFVFFRWPITKRWGALLTALYVSYLVLVIV